MTTDAGVRVEGPARIVGLYSTTAVDWIAEHVVTEAMVDHAIIQGVGTPNRKASARVQRALNSPGRRATARRNIAVGIRCGSYAPYFS